MSVVCCRKGVYSIRQWLVPAEEAVGAVAHGGIDGIVELAEVGGEREGRGVGDVDELMLLVVHLDAYEALGTRAADGYLAAGGGVVVVAIDVALVGVACIGTDIIGCLVSNSRKHDLTPRLRL